MDVAGHLEERLSKNERELQIPPSGHGARHRLLDWLGAIVVRAVKMRLPGRLTWARRRTLGKVLNRRLQPTSELYVARRQIGRNQDHISRTGDDTPGTILRIYHRWDRQVHVGTSKVLDGRARCGVFLFFFRQQQCRSKKRSSRRKSLQAYLPPDVFSGPHGQSQSLQPRKIRWRTKRWLVFLDG